MSACILFGHRFTLMRGAGQFKDAEFLVCEACGKTIPVTEDQTKSAARETASQSNSFTVSPLK